MPNGISLMEIRQQRILAELRVTPLLTDIQGLQFMRYSILLETSAIHSHTISIHQ
jgi:hypothetical protein